MFTQCSRSKKVGKPFLNKMSTIKWQNNVSWYKLFNIQIIVVYINLLILSVFFLYKQKSTIKGQSNLLNTSLVHIFLYTQKFHRLLACIFNCCYWTKTRKSTQHALLLNAWYVTYLLQDLCTHLLSASELLRSTCKYPLKEYVKQRLIPYTTNHCIIVYTIYFKTYSSFRTSC